MGSEFTAEEGRILEPFVTNLDKPIFALRNMPEVVMGAMFSRYSRTTKSLRRVLLDEFINDKESGFQDIVGISGKGGDTANQLIATRKAEEFYDRVLVGYGDDSVAELGGAHIACEQVSMIASKVLEDSRIGLSPLEKSTRYVYFNQKINGEYNYYRGKELVDAAFGPQYIQACNLLFDTYSDLMGKMGEWVMGKYPKEPEVSDRAYQSTVRAKVCDILRGLLPASALTNVGIFGNGRAFEYLLLKMYASDLQEMNGIAGEMQEELNKVIPSFVKRADDKYGKEAQQYLRETRTAIAGIAGEKATEEPQNAEEVALVDFDKDAEGKIIAAILYPQADLPLRQIKEIVAKMGADEKKAIFSEYLKRRQNRRHKGGRALENASYTFDILGNFGQYRDLHRHRQLTQERQLIGCKHGYDLPKELVEAGHEGEFKEAMEKAKAAWETINKENPQLAQYVVPLAYKLRWYFTLNLREVIHLTELRSMRQGHPDYRRVAQKIYSEVRRVHPQFAEQIRFVDMNEYGLERLESEKKIDRKLDEINKKYGK
ncbi:MAG: FAD-dependent thymidylate synthase [Candidatus Micrarchaeota archaeon]